MESLNSMPLFTPSGVAPLGASSFEDFSPLQRGSLHGDIFEEDVFDSWDCLIVKSSCKRRSKDVKKERSKKNSNKSKLRKQTLQLCRTERTKVNKHMRRVKSGSYEKRAIAKLVSKKLRRASLGKVLTNNKEPEIETYANGMTYVYDPLYDDDSDEYSDCDFDFDEYSDDDSDVHFSQCPHCGDYDCDGDCGMWYGCGIPPEPCDCCFRMSCICSMYDNYYDNDSSDSDSSDSEFEDDVKSRRIARRQMYK